MTDKRKFVSDDVMEILPIGGGQEVGRSCVLLKFKGKQIMVGQAVASCAARCGPPKLSARVCVCVCCARGWSASSAQFDAGIHPAFSGFATLPFFDMIDDPAAIDLLLVTQLRSPRARASCFVVFAHRVADAVSIWTIAARCRTFWKRCPSSLVLHVVALVAWRRRVKRARARTRALAADELQRKVLHDAPDQGGCENHAERLRQSLALIRKCGSSSVVARARERRAAACETNGRSQTRSSTRNKSC